MTKTRFGALRGVVNSSAIDNGAFCHFVVPEGLPNEGTPMYLDPVKQEHPVGAIVRSVDSAHYRAKGFNIQSKAINVAQRAKANERDKKLEDQMMQERPLRFAALVVCFRNGGPDQKGDIVPTQDELVELGGAGDTQWMVKQVMDFAHDLANFGGESKGNVAAAPESETGAA